MSWEYPNSFAFLILRLISLGLKWVIVAFNNSNLEVPSLKICTSCLALKIPFSSGSISFVSETIPFTPLTMSGTATFSPFLACSNISLSLTSCIPPSTVWVPHFIHWSPATPIPQVRQYFIIFVLSLHL